MDIKNLKIYGFKNSIVRSGYPKRFGEPNSKTMNEFYELTSEDEKRFKHLSNCDIGQGHDCFLKGIVVQFDLKYTQYFSMQMERYNWFDIISSQSKMHTITQRGRIDTYCNKWVDEEIIERVNYWIEKYNNFDNEIQRLKDISFNNSTPLFNENKNLYPDNKICIDNKNKEIVWYSKDDLFMKIISNTPMGFELWAGITTNYLQLKTIYKQRKNHKLPEWKWFCEWMINNLPMFDSVVKVKEARK